MFTVKVLVAPAHSKYALGLGVKSKDELAICGDRPKEFVQKRRAEKFAASICWPGFTFEVV